MNQCMAIIDLERATNVLLYKRSEFLIDLNTMCFDLYFLNRVLSPGRSSYVPDKCLG